jgi:hypothetical protein
VQTLEVADRVDSDASRVPFLTQQPMRVYASMWDAEEWAT